MEPKAILVFVAVVSIGMIFLGALIESVGYYTSTTANTINNESINFATNNTCYATSRGPINTITGIYNDTAHTATYATDRYSFAACDGGIKIYSNGTGQPPNMTTGTRIVTYTIYKNNGLAGVLMTFISAVLILVVVLKIFNWV